MKRGTALLIALLLLVTLPLPAAAQGQRLLYPPVQVQDDSVLCFATSLEGGNVSVTANGTPVECTATPLAQTSLGITYYCVVGLTSSLSNIQKEQERVALTALSEALGEKDSLVLVSMNRQIQFGEKLTDSAARKSAIDEFLTYTSFGTNLYEGIDTVLNTIAESETDPCCVVFITDGYDNAEVMKVTEEQAGRVIQNSGLSVSFIGVMTPPFNSNGQQYHSERLERFAALSLGGVCHIPLEEEPNSYILAAQNAAREIVNRVADWTVVRLDAAQLPRDQKTIDLTVTWSGSGNTVSDTVQLATADLPAIVEPVVPPTAPPTEPPATLPPTEPPTEPETEPIPVYQDNGEEKQLWFTAIGIAAAVAVVILVLVIFAVRKSVAPGTPADKGSKNSRKRPAPPEPVTELRPEASKPEIPKPEILKAEIPEPETAPEAERWAFPEDISIPTDIDLPEDPQAMLDALYAELSLLPEEDTPAQTPPESSEPDAPLPPASSAKQETAPPESEKKRRPPFDRPAASRREPEPAPTVKPIVPEPVIPAPITPGVPTCTISLTPEGDPDGTVKIVMEVNGSCTLGRNKKSDIILNETDSALSGLHFELQWDGRVLHLADCGSTNGTSLSGIPQRPGHWSRVESGTTIQAGSVRYKIHIHKN